MVADEQAHLRADTSSPPRANTVLVVDDEESFHDAVNRHLRAFRVIPAYNGLQALAALDRYHVDVVLLDLNMPGISGFDLLDRIRVEHDDVEVIIVTAHSELRNAVTAVKKGAFDFVAKSYESYKQLSEYIDRALIHRRRRREEIEKRSHHWWINEAFTLMKRSRSEGFRAVMRLVDQVAPTPLTVLLEGESGVGKEIMARYLHATSERANAPFVTANLASVPATLLDSHLFGHVRGAFTGADKTRIGKFELADGGTLFLDEIGELEPTAQVKLLRVLQEREIERLGAPEPSPVDIRLIVATNADLKELVEAGQFREDLYYRLNVVPVHIPPLRSRKEDLADLADLLIGKYARSLRRRPLEMSPEAMIILGEHDWPGNIRELENIIMRLVALHPGKTITPDDIPTEYCLSSLHRVAGEFATRGADSDAHKLYFLAKEQFERYLVRLMVNRHHGDKRAAARTLGVSLSTIKGKLRGG